MNSDFRDLLQILEKFNVRYLIVGGYAVIHHAQPRYTKDIDLWIEPSEENAAKLMRAFYEFGLPLIDITEADFAQPRVQYSIGVAPCVIDFLTSIPGLEFEPSWKNKVICRENDFDIYYLAKQDLIKAKQTAGRPQDLADIDELRRANP